MAFHGTTEQHLERFNRQLDAVEKAIAVAKKDIRGDDCDAAAIEMGNAMAVLAAADNDLSWVEMDPTIPTGAKDIARRARNTLTGKISDLISHWRSQCTCRSGAAQSAAAEKTARAAAAARASRSSGTGAHYTAAFLSEHARRAIIIEAAVRAGHIPPDAEAIADEIVKRIPNRESADDYSVAVQEVIGRLGARAAGMVPASPVAVSTPAVAVKATAVTIRKKRSAQQQVCPECARQGVPVSMTLVNVTAGLYRCPTCLTETTNTPEEILEPSQRLQGLGANGNDGDDDDDAGVNVPGFRRGPSGFFISQGTQASVPSRVEREALIAAYALTQHEQERGATRRIAAADLASYTALLKRLQEDWPGVDMASAEFMQDLRAAAEVWWALHRHDPGVVLTSEHVAIVGKQRTSAKDIRAVQRRAALVPVEVITRPGQPRPPFTSMQKSAPLLVAEGAVFLVASGRVINVYHGAGAQAAAQRARAELLAQGPIQTEYARRDQPRPIIRARRVAIEDEWGEETGETRRVERVTGTTAPAGGTEARYYVVAVAEALTCPKCQLVYRPLLPSGEKIERCVVCRHEGGAYIRLIKYGSRRR